MKISGKAWRFGKNVNTDLIFPNRYFKPSYAPGELGSHVMSGADPDFPAKVKKGDIIVGASNFGCGSSREEAAGTMREAGIGALVAPSFGRIFMRNCINLGVPVVPCPGIDEHVSEGDVLEVDLSAGRVTNRTNGHVAAIAPIAPELLELLGEGGIIEYTSRELARRRAGQPPATH